MLLCPILVSVPLVLAAAPTLSAQVQTQTKVNNFAAALNTAPVINFDCVRTPQYVVKTPAQLPPSNTATSTRLLLPTTPTLAPLPKNAASKDTALAQRGSAVLGGGATAVATPLRAGAGGTAPSSVVMPTAAPGITSSMPTMSPTAAPTAPVPTALLGTSPAPALPQLLPCPQKTFSILEKVGLQGSAAFMAQGVDNTAPVFFAHNPDASLALASTAKLVTSIAAIENLGLAFRWKTRAYLLGPLKDGVLDGDLLIVGGGDPTLTGKALEKWFLQMQAKGLKEIRGNLVLDKNIFKIAKSDMQGTPKEDEDNPHHRWPDALSIDEGYIQTELSVQGGAAQLRFNPPLDVAVDNQLKVLPKCAVRSPPQIEIVEQSTGADRASILRLQGEWSEACGKKHIEMVTGSDLALTGAILAGIWKSTGGVLVGQAFARQELMPKMPKSKQKELGQRLPPKVFSELASAPLSEVLREMNKTSNNLIARHLMLSLSPKFPKLVATLAGAKQYTQGWLQRKGLVGIAVDSGSGLSRAERAHARSMIALLRKSWNTRYGKVLLGTLPVAGKDGTLRARMHGSPAQGNAFLKTGSLNDARALAGYVRSKSGKIYAVVTLINHPRAKEGVPAMDAFIEWVVQNG